MKHQTHIYIARKAIEMLYDSLSQIKHRKGRLVEKTKRDMYREEAKKLQRILRSHIDSISEASWAPDDIINDKSTFHVFKLYTAEEFGDYAEFAKETHTYGGKNYYRAKGGGGLPYKVDHLSRMINDMFKLRKFNDSFGMNQIMYQLFLLSHYVVDACVPMHCDIRDDKPSKKKPSDGLYYKQRMHGDLEKRWEKAVLPVGISEKLLIPEKGEEKHGSSRYSEAVKYDLKRDSKEIPTTYLKSGDLMDYMIDLCIRSKERSLRLFPVDEPSRPALEDFGDMTREIFNDAIGNVVSVWMSIWINAQPKRKQKN